MWTKAKEGIYFFVKVVPKASFSSIVGWEEQELKVRLAAVPEKGQANKELIKVLAKELGVSQSQVILVKGETSRHKRILLSGVGEETLSILEKF